MSELRVQLVQKENDRIWGAAASLVSSKGVGKQDFC